MATERWTAGITIGSYTAAFGAEVNSLAAGDSVLSSVSFDNSANGDTAMQISVAISSMTTPANVPLLQFYMYPLNQDGSTYGDGAWTTTPAAGNPANNYLLDGTIPLVPSVTQAQEGTTVMFPIPFVMVQFKLVLFNNNPSNALGSTVTVKARTFNRSVA